VCASAPPHPFVGCRHLDQDAFVALYCFSLFFDVFIGFSKKTWHFAWEVCKLGSKSGSTLERKKSTTQKAWVFEGRDPF